MQHKFDKALAKEALIVTIGLIIVGSIIAPLISSFTSGFGLTLGGLPSFQTLITGGIFSFLGLYIGVLLAVWIAKWVATMRMKL